MFEENGPIKIYCTTFTTVMKNLATIKDSPIEDIEDTIEEKFAEYNYEGEEEIIGYDTWGDISQDGEYELMVKINHKDAYEFTLYATVKDGKISVKNVL